MKSIDYYEKKYNRNKLLLIMILKYDGEVIKEYQLKREWTFLSFAVASIDEDENLYNALSDKEKFNTVEIKDVKIGDEIVQIVDFATEVLTLDEKIISKKQIYNAMKQSSLYFRDCDDSLIKEKSKLKKL